MYEARIIISNLFTSLLVLQSTFLSLNFHYGLIFFQVRTDRSVPFYDGDDNPNVNLLRDILLTYSFYNFDLGYCQVITSYVVTMR